ncbi:MAG: hypothetical protein JNJ73_00700 [Hyphomonadaceae bacterium]|nr:hypothetical protein [Hyphomonadaceae bacterium]
MAQRTTIRMKGELLSAAKRRAAEQGRTLTDFIEEAVRAALARSHPPAKRAEVIVSKETGGAFPGIDLNRTGELIGMLDDEKWFELEARLKEEAKLAKEKERQGAK